jgi:hypothetical protein
MRGPCVQSSFSGEHRKLLTIAVQIQQSICLRLALFFATGFDSPIDQFFRHFQRPHLVRDVLPSPTSQCVTIDRRAQMIRMIPLLVAFLVSVVPLQAAPIVFTAALSGPNEEPPNASPGTGFAIVTIDDIADTMPGPYSRAGLFTSAGLGSCRRGNAPSAATLKRRHSAHDRL